MTLFDLVMTSMICCKKIIIIIIIYNLICRSTSDEDSLHKSCSACGPTTFLDFLHVRVCTMTAPAQLTHRNLFAECRRWICFHLLSAPQSAALSKNRALRNEFPEKSRVRRAGNNSAAAAASVVVAAVSVREMEKGGSVIVCESKLVRKRVPLHCTGRS